MYQSAGARPGPSQASKINLLARIVNVFKLMLPTIFCQKYHRPDMLHFETKIKRPIYQWNT